MAENSSNRMIIILLILLGVLAVGGLAFLGSRDNVQPTPVAPGPGQASSKPGQSGPQFDVVRVDAGGNAVIAGRASPGAKVIISLGKTVLGTVTADASGSFAFVPAKALPPGAQQLTLSEVHSDGQIIPGKAPVTISVPAAPGEGALAVLAGNGATASTVLSGQGPQAGTLGLGTIDYDSEGHAIFAGTAPAGSKVSIGFAGQSLGSTMADASGRWQMKAALPMQPGEIHLQATASDGKVLASLDKPFTPAQVAGLDGRKIVVKSGQNLWVIARRIYGSGVMYTLIFKANASSIHNPNLIYPGQNFAVPVPVPKS
jgi:nucleoid-associated protein YgaU